MAAHAVLLQATPPSQAHQAAHGYGCTARRRVVILYGQLWRPGTHDQAAPPDPPRIHVDDTARQTLPALQAPPGRLTIVADDRSTPHHSPG